MRLSKSMAAQKLQDLHLLTPQEWMTKYKQHPHYYLHYWLTKLPPEMQQQKQAQMPKPRYSVPKKVSRLFEGVSVPYPMPKDYVLFKWHEGKWVPRSLQMLNKLKNTPE
jgi:hypothetical protein